jgi:hypothetical protein
MKPRKPWLPGIALLAFGTGFAATWSLLPGAAADDNEPSSREHTAHGEDNGKINAALMEEKLTPDDRFSLLSGPLASS